MRASTAIALVGMMAVLPLAQADATAVLDQHIAAPGSGSYHLVDVNFFWAQTVQAQLSGQLTRIDLPIARYANVTEPLVIAVYPTTTSGAPNDAVAALAMVTLPALAVPVKVTGQPADKQIDFLNGPWMQAGDRFSIVLTSQTPVGAFSTEYLWLTTPQGENPYPQNAYGKSQTNPTWSALAGSAIQDHTFSTFVVVPEPSALAGMTVGLFVARRARKFAQQLA